MLFDSGFILFRPPLVSHFQLVRGRAAASTHDCRLDGWPLRGTWWNWSGRCCVYGMHRRKTYDRENGYGGLSGYEQLGGNGEHRGDREN